jgi:uncharacterized protein (DUF1778 family)
MPVKEARLEMRLTKEQKALLERAAAVAGLDLTAFALSLLTEQARQILEKQTRTELSLKDQKRFLEIIESDEEPTPALKAAVKRYRSKRA